MGRRFPEENILKFGSESRGMAISSVCRLLFWVTFCGGVLLSAASPTRRQFVSLTETTSSDPAAVVTDDGAVWDDTDEFDLDGDEDWLSEAAVSPSSIPQPSEYEDYDDDAYASRRPSNVVVDLTDEDNDVEHQDAEEDSTSNEAEFLFVPSRDSRLMLQDDDDDQSGPIKVRHTGKNSYPEVPDTDSSKEDKSYSNRQFEFTIDNDDDDDDQENEVIDDASDFVLDDAQKKDNANHVQVRSQQESRDDEDDEEDEEDGDFVVDGDGKGDAMFESPEEDSQVIYGDHVFLY